MAKIDGSYIFDSGPLNGLVIGGYQEIMDGTPLTTSVSIGGIGMYVNNRGDLGRTDTWTQTDLYVEYSIKFGKYRALFNVNVDNLFDQSIEIRRNIGYGRDSVSLTQATLAEMWRNKTPIDWKSYYNGSYDTWRRLNPNYNKSNVFQGSRVIRAGIKLVF